MAWNLRAKAVSMNGYVLKRGWLAGGFSYLYGGYEISISDSELLTVLIKSFSKHLMKER